MALRPAISLYEIDPGFKTENVIQKLSLSQNQKVIWQTGRNKFCIYFPNIYSLHLLKSCLIPIYMNLSELDVQVHSQALLCTMVPRRLAD